MISRWPLWLVLAGLVLAGPGRADPVEACPGEQGCQVEGGHYRLVLPDAAPAAPLPALMYFHGWQGSAEETAADPGLRALATRLGIALIAPDGAGRTWSYPGSPGRHRDEFAFVGRVLDDVAARFPVDSRRIMASGFSQGGSMVWYLACRTPERLRAFAPVAGAFWEPLPASCTGPRPALVHTHGTADGTVPLAGRALRSGFRQGDVFRSLGDGGGFYHRSGCALLPAAERGGHDAPRTLPAPGRPCRRSRLDRAGLAADDGRRGGARRSPFREAVTADGSAAIVILKRRPGRFACEELPA